MKRSSNGRAVYIDRDDSPSIADLIAGGAFLLFMFAGMPWLMWLIAVALGKA